MADRADIFRFLFRIATQARRLSTDAFLRRLAVGIANRYGAASCSICRFGVMRKTVWASLGPPLLDLSSDEQDYLYTLDGRLVQRAADTGAVVSAMDLDLEGDVSSFLDEVLPQMDIFAFPLLTDDVLQGALVLYLPTDATPLGEVDLQALLAVGDILHLSDTATRDAASADDLFGAHPKRHDRTAPQRVEARAAT